MKTYSPKPRDIERRWYVIDASGAVLGRLSTEVAAILRGKHKPIFAPHMDTGDHVIVVNAKGVRLTGGKEQTKVAYRHSGYPGGITATPYARLLADKPAYAVEKAIRGMLPKNRLGRAMAKKLQVYPGPEHPHRAQKPQALALGEVPRWDGLPVPRETPAEPAPSSAPEEPARTATRSPAERATAERSTAKRTTATAASATAKKSTATAKKSTATAKKSTATAKKSTAKKTTAKRTTAKTSSTRSAPKRSTARRRTKEE